MFSHSDSDVPDIECSIFMHFVMCSYPKGVGKGVNTI